MNDSYKGPVRVERATTPEELHRIQQLRYEVYSAEMGLDLPGLDHEQKRLEEELDQSAVHLYAAARGEIAGAVRINEDRVPNGLEAILKAQTLPRPFCYCSRLYVRKQFRGGGVVSRLTKASFAEFYRLNAAVAICHCYPHLQNLYERMGFRAYGKPFQQPGLDSLGWQRPLMCVLRPEMVLRSA